MIAADKQALSFLERVALHFPESRTLAERFELFYAEALHEDEPSLQVDIKGLRELKMSQLKAGIDAKF